MKEIMSGSNYTNCKTVLEKYTWHEFVWVIKNFLGNKESKNYPQHIEQLTLHFHFNMSIKLYFLFSDEVRFPENLGDLSKGQLTFQIVKFEAATGKRKFEFSEANIFRI